MRIAFLCKRRYMGKDVILDRYARLYEIPFQLARLGHVVGGFCTSYQRHEPGAWSHDAAPGRLEWESHSLGRWVLPGLAAWPLQLLQHLRAFAPDVVIGASDIPHVVLGAWLAKRLGVPYAVDLYDNFEGFGQARIPGMVPLLRRAVRHAAVVTTTSELLKQLVVDTYRAQGIVVAMPSTVDMTVFHPRDKLECRRALGLPEEAVLFGTAGGLLADRGIDVVYAAWQLLAARNERAALVLAGPTDPRSPPPTGQRVYYLGMLQHARTAELFCALDVGVIYLADTKFGRYCFPQKAYEMIACGLPIAGARLGALPDLLADAPASLYTASDAEDLARAIQEQLERPTPIRTKIKDWRATVADLDSALRQLVANRRRG